MEVSLWRFHCSYSYMTMKLNSTSSVFNMQRSVLTSDFANYLLENGLGEAYLFMTLVPTAFGIMCKHNIYYSLYTVDSYQIRC